MKTSGATEDPRFENAPKLRFTLTRSDIRLFSRYAYLQKRPWRTVMRLVAMVVLIVLGVIHALYMSAARSSPTDPWTFTVLLFLSPSFAWGIIILLWTVLQCFATRSPNRPECTLALTEYGVLSEQEGARHMLTWAIMIDIARDRHALYGFLTPVYALILPRRAFFDQADMDLWFVEMRRLWQDKRFAPSAPPPPVNAISVTYAADEKSFQRSYFWASSQQPKKRRKLLITALTLGLVTGVWLSVWGPSALQFLGSILWPVNAVLGLSLVLGNRLYSRLLARQVARVPGALAPNTVSLTTDGLVTRGQTSWSFLPWEQIVRIHADSALIYFLLPASTVVFVPRAAFLDSAQADAFIAAAHSYKAGNAPDTGGGEAWPPRPAI